MADERARGWRTFGERAVFEGAAVWVGQVDVGSPDGERSWRPVVRLPRSAAMVLADDEARVLLVWRHRFVRDRWGWELPGGPVDDDEEASDAAARELEEESGYRAGRVEPLIVCQLAVEAVDAEHHVFAGRDPVLAGERSDLAQGARAEWVPVASVPGLIAAGQIWAAGSLVGLLHYMTVRSPGTSGG